MSSQTKDAAADLQIGTEVGAYRVESVLGIGAMGIVYRATARDGTNVALKMIKRDYARDKTFQRRFEREARIAQTIRNPHVVPVLDVGTHDGIPYMVAQFVDGSSLEQRLRREKRLDVPATVRICVQIANGLEAIAAAGTVHRDVKPANILLDSVGRAYITDFGLAKDSQGTTGLTLPGQALGSLDYMSPEQIRGEPVSAATDVYALGCVVYECLQGQPPFADRQGMRVLWAHLHDVPPDPCAGGRDVTPALAAAVRVAMRKEPSERPGSSSEYARSLCKAAGLSIPAE